MEEKDISRSWHDFTQETTMHGIRYVKLTGTSVVRRIIWSIIILGCLVYLCYAGYKFLDSMNKRSLKTQIKVRNAANLTFPTVTICNRNYWKLSKVDDPNFPLRAREQFREIMKDIYIPSADSLPPEDKYNWSDPILASRMDEDMDADAKMRSYAHALNETFMFCLIKGQPMPCNETLVQVKTDAGFCYQFNGDGKFVSHTAGLSGGVQFYLNTLNNEYYVGPFSYSEGFSVAIHDSEVIPLLSELSYGLNPGMETSMILHKKETIRVPPPADDNQSDCFDAENLPNPLHYYDTYSYSACYYECQISHVINKCGCRDFLQPPFNNSKTCNIKMMIYCVTPALREFKANSEYLSRCACKSACHETQYSAMLSTYNFPSAGKVKELEHRTGATAEYMKSNYVAVDIFYGQMSYELLKEEIEYTIPDMIANVGGTLGVCIGASLLTLVEFTEFVIISIARLLSRNFSKKNQTTQVKVFKNSISTDDSISKDDYRKEQFKSYEDLRVK